MTPDFVACPAPGRRPFRVSRRPVTNREFADLVAAGGAPPPPHWRGTVPPEVLADHPVVDVTRAEAAAYCRFVGALVGARVRLPSVAEWEWAARGDDDRPFPWGGSFEPGRANTVEAGHGTTTPVDAFPAGVGPFGTWDQAGNAWEWCRDTGDDGWGVVKGGSFLDTEWGVFAGRRLAADPRRRSPNVGFRVVRDG